MLDKLQLWLKSKIGQPYAYYITCAIYLIGTFLGLFIVGYLFGVGWQVILIAVLMSILRNFTSGMHCHSNGKCFIISSIVLVMFSIIAETIPMWIVFLLCLYSCANIYKVAPIELNDDYDVEDEDWFFKRVVIIMVIYLVSSLCTYYMHLYLLTKCILLSIILTNLLLFHNDKEYI